MKGQVQVYRNLTPKKGVKMAFGDKAVFSVKNDKGLVYDWVTEISLFSPVFRVSKKGNERVRKEKRKNVHAYIQGKRMGGQLRTLPDTQPPESEWHKITYNPYKHEHFVLANDQSTRVTEAVIAEINQTGVWAFRPTLKKYNALEV